MQISLKPSLQQFVARKLDAGQYADESDIINEALEVMMEQEEFSEDQSASLRHELKRGLDQLTLGQTSPLDAQQIIAEERAHLRDRGTAK